MLAKSDLCRAYRLLHVHPSLNCFFGMFWQGQFYIDLAVPFGLRSAPKVFTCFADVLQQIFKQKGGVAYILHYLVDFSLQGLQPQPRRMAHHGLVNNFVWLWGFHWQKTKQKALPPT